MKKVFVFIAFLTPLLITDVTMARSQIQSKVTTCNLRYNNVGIIAGGIKCEASVNGSGSLRGIKFLHTNSKWYAWFTNMSAVENDRRWSECLRYTFPEGNQWQICTVSPLKEIFSSK